MTTGGADFDSGRTVTGSRILLVDSLDVVTPLICIGCLEWMRKDLFHVKGMVFTVIRIVRFRAGTKIGWGYFHRFWCFTGICPKPDLRFGGEIETGPEPMGWVTGPVCEREIGSAYRACPVTVQPAVAVSPDGGYGG